MNTTNFQSSNKIRLQFTRAMSDMYQLEVPMYKKLLSLANDVNQNTIKQLSPLTTSENSLLKLEHHAAIRVGLASELSMIRRLFKVMGMQPVDYYDLSVAGIPVHSTAFRALKSNDLEISPFRIFCSLLRLDLIEDKKLQQQVNTILDKRQIFPEELLTLIELSEKQGGLTQRESDSFIDNALEVFRWHQNATVDKHTYDELKDAHGLIADIISFKGPHINHLTPKVLDIDACQAQFAPHDIKAKADVEGPPKRDCPILLRQTSFIAIAEDVIFTEGKTGTHNARFGEVEQRGIALTPKGRELYDRLLLQARNTDDQGMPYNIRLSEAFKQFPDTYDELRREELAYFHYASINSDNINENSNIQLNNIETLISQDLIKVTPIVYEDFLPVSAAGIFTSNLSSESKQTKELETIPMQKENSNREHFEEALGIKVENSFELYKRIQQESLNKALKDLSAKL
ncbi:MAG: DUF1338 family protein [Cocleimonas sp.]